MSFDHQRVAENVRERLREQGLTQLMLGAYLGLSPQAVSDRMNGRTPFTLAEASALAGLFGTTYEALLGDPQKAGR